MAIKELFYDNRPQVLLDPRASQRIDPRFKYTRNSIGTYFNNDGLLQVAQANEPRFDHDPSTKESLGMICEPGRTNLVARSQEINTWTFSNYNNALLATVTANDATYLAPDGTQTVDKIDFNGSPALQCGQRGVVQPDTWYTVSAWAYTTNSNYDIAIAYGIDNTRVGNIALIKLPTSTTADGKLRRIVAYFKTPSTAGLNTFEMLFTKGGTSSGGFAYVWGAQVEAGRGVTSYIPTTSAAVTRAADILSVEAPLPATGSIYIDARAVVANENDTLLSLKNSSNDKIDLAYLSNASTYNSLALLANYDGTSKTTLPLPVPTTARERNIITWGANNYQYTRDSSRFATSLSSSVPTGLNQLSIGHDAVDPTKAFNGYINTVYAWSGELTPAVAEALVRNDVDPKDADAGVFTPAAGSLAFVFNTQGTATDGDRVVQLPLRGSTNKVSIKWGDETTNNYIGAAASSNVSHTYPAAGLYAVEISAINDGTNNALENLDFNSSSPTKLLSILQWGGTATYRPTNMYRAFSGCTEMDFATAARTNPPDTSKVVNWSEAFDNCRSISGTFPGFNFSSATNLYATWRNCSSLETLPALGDQTALVTNVSSAWNGCTSLTSFPQINTSSVTNYTAAWQNCSSLTSFPLINTAAGTNFTSAWTNCNSLTSFPLINTGAGTSFSSAWYGCSNLTSFPLINTAAGTDFGGAWRSCSGLTNFPLINTAAGTNFGYTWSGCSSLTNFPLINTAAGTSFVAAWNGCSSLTSFPLINTAAGTNFSLAWFNNAGLTAFPALNFNSATGLASDASNTYTGFRQAWYSSDDLANFPANLFDNTTCTRYLDAWTGCALTAQSIENIIVSINTAGTSNGNLGLSAGTNAGASTWTAPAIAAYDALIARGWTIVRNA